MILKNGYSGIGEEDIMKLSAEQMREILIKIINYETKDSSGYYPTDMILPDDVADILRGRYIN